jgi:hypothetical protein
VDLSNKRRIFSAVGALSMNTCLVKYFGGPEITQVDVVNILKNLLFACTLDELRKLEESRGVPPCV